MSQPGDHQARQADVVILDEDDALSDARILREAHDRLDQLFAWRVGGMRLAGEHELHRAVGVGQQARQSIGLTKEQRRPLVGREPAREPDA